MVQIRTASIAMGLAALLASASAAAASERPRVEWVAGEATIGCLRKEWAERFVKEPDLLTPMPSREWLLAKSCVHFKPGLHLDIAEGHNPARLTRWTRRDEIWKVALPVTDGAAPVFSYVRGLDPDVAPESSNLPAQIAVLPGGITSKEVALQAWKHYSKPNGINFEGVKVTPIIVPNQPGFWMLIIDGLGLRDAVHICDSLFESTHRPSDCLPNPL